MKLKTSFFNPAIFKKNVTQYWPIWGAYTLLLFCLQPLLLWFAYAYARNWEDRSPEYKLGYLTETMMVKPYIYIIFFVAIFVGMAVFHYIYNNKSANMIHALPVDRLQLFGTNTISGLAFLIVPQVFVCAITFVTCLAKGVNHLEVILLWLLVLIAIDIAAFGIVAFCTFLTGQLFMMPIYVFVFNAIIYIFYALINYVVSEFAYGVEYGTVLREKVAKYFSPFLSMLDNVTTPDKYNEADKLVGITVKGGQFLIIYAILGVVLLVLAYLMYRKRHIEQTGDMITVRWIRPIFRWGFGFCGAYAASLVLRSMFQSIERELSLGVFLIILLVCGGICYFLADMLIKKSFRVFFKKNWIQVAVFAVVLVLSYGGFVAYAEETEEFVPDASIVKEVTVNNYYTITYKGKDIEKVLDLHEDILDYYEDYGTDSWRTKNIQITYKLIGGMVVTRSYPISYEGEGLKLLERVMAEELKGENFLKHWVTESYDKVDKFTVGSLELPVFSEEYGVNYNYIDIDAEDCQVLYDAMVADALAGTLAPYNVHYYYMNGDKYESYGTSAYLRLEFEIPEEDRNQNEVEDEEVNGGVYSTYEVLPDDWNERGYVNLTFGSDCENIVQAMIELEIIDSVEDIFGDSRVDEDYTDPDLEKPVY